MTHSVRVTTEDANNYSRILTLLGMEEEGDPVEGVRQLQLALETLRSDHGVAWLLVDQYKDRLEELEAPVGLIQIGPQGRCGVLVDPDSKDLGRKRNHETNS